MPGRLKFILAYILAELVQVSYIVKIAVHNDACGEAFIWVNLLPDPVCDEYIAIIAGIPIDGLLYIINRRIRLSFKLIVYFDQKFK